ncbi:hypothetical protein FA13DRAFT_334652 [Coprinellus micaceus]|uniref:Extracellular membrane protein CFEM domain-containing protein n=1 Tax=Coprinellus micaceus TaxID=71717 RepID=A0A4Y7TBU1_COPMI|nr:hypothetical protein FA13DRAFT_334652 [Coprinellus micaceus]
MLVTQRAAHNTVLLVLALLTYVSAYNVSPALLELGRRQTTTESCRPACADRDALQEACAAAGDGDCCRPTYPSAHLTCAYCLSYGSGIDDEQRERLHRSAQAYVERMSTDCARQGQPLDAASVTLTITAGSTTATATQTTRGGSTGTATTASGNPTSTGQNGASSSISGLENLGVALLLGIGASLLA